MTDEKDPREKLDHEWLVRLKAEAERRGYRFEIVEDDEGTEERMIRPDETVAVIARKKASDDA